MTYAKFGQMSEAAPYAERAVELQPDNPDMRYIFGCVLLDIGRPAEAAEQFEETLQLAPYHAGAREGLERARQLRSP